MLVERVLIDIIGNDKASRAFDTAAASAGRAAKKIDGAAALTMRAGAKLTKAVTVPMIAIGVVSLMQAAKFQKANTLLQTAGGETVAKMRVISSGIKTVATDTGTSLTDLETGMYTVAKAGSQKWSAVGQLKVLRAAAEGAKAELVPMSTSVDALTSVMQSYGYGVGKAVKTEDMLIRGSALAKTTMQQFAGSLSNVVPLAASLHISFAQVAGSLATMTQHGESVDQASQNLNNLLTNLAGQNNIASATMQQLGIKTIQLQRNLGKEGISGALSIVEKHLAANSKGGMIVVSAFKQAQIATHSLDVMVSHMTGTLASNSKALRDGSMSLTDYRTYARSLGGQQGAMAMQFYTLIQKALGFNDALKSGNGDVQTAATMLKKMLGGMTGMRAALMLTGKSASQNASNIKQVGDAADHAGKHVLGWGKTSQTMSMKVDKLKASAQVLAVNLGNDLIPAAEKLIGWLQAGVEWFDKLPTPIRHNIIAAGLLAAALGPLLIIGSRILTMFKLVGAMTMFGARFIAGVRQAEISLEGMQTTAYNTGLKISQSATMTRLAIGGIGIAMGTTVGMMTRDSSTATKVVSDLGSAAAGAAIGFSMGGPWGAAIGGITGGLSALATQFIGTGNSADQASKVAIAGLQLQNGAAQNLLSTLKETHGVYNRLAKDAALDQLSQGSDALGGKSALDVASKYGIDLHAVLKAVLGNSAAFNKQFNAVSHRYAASSTQGKELFAFITLMQKITGGATAAERSFEQWQAAQGKGIVSTKLLAGGLANLSKEFKNTGHTLDQDSAFGSRNQKVIESNIRYQQKQLAAGKISYKEYAAFIAGIGPKLKALHFDLSTVISSDHGGQLFSAILQQAELLPTKMRQALANKMFFKIQADDGPVKQKVAEARALIQAIKQGKQPLIGVDTAEAKTLLIELQAYISNLHDKQVTVTTRLQTVGRLPAISTTTPSPHAAGGSVADGWFTVGEQGGPNGWELGRKHGSRVDIYSNRDSRKMTGLDRLPGYASGSGASSSASSSAVSGAIGRVGSSSSSPINVGSTGIRIIDAQIAHAEAVLAEQIRKGLSASAAATFRRQLARLKGEAERQLAALKVKIAKPDTRALRAALLGTVSDAQTALSTLLADARAAGVSPDEIKRLDGMQSKILAKMRETDRLNARLGTAPTRPTAYDRLASAKSNYANEVSATKSAMLGGFDIATAGQVYNDQAATGSSILVSLRATVAKVKTFGAVLKKLHRKGLSPVLLVQLAHAGPDALGQAQAILSSGDGTIESITKAYANLNTYAKDAGKLSGDAMYGAGVKSAQKIVNGLLSQRAALRKAMGRLGDDLVDEVERKLGGHGGGHGHGHHGGRREASVHVDKIVITGQNDPVATANAVTRRLAHLGAA